MGGAQLYDPYAAVPPPPPGMVLGALQPPPPPPVMDTVDSWQPAFPRGMPFPTAMEGFTKAQPPNPEAPPFPEATGTHRTSGEEELEKGKGAGKGKDPNAQPRWLRPKLTPPPGRVRQDAEAP